MSVNIQELLENRSKLSKDTLPELKELVEKYPFFQLARLLYVANLYQQHSPDFGPELRKASVFVPDRIALFTISEGVNYQLPTSPSASNIETEDEGNRTLSLIESFLSDSKAIEVEDDNNEAEGHTQHDMAMYATDYASFLIQQDEEDGMQQRLKKASKTKTKNQLRGGALIDNFIESTRGRQRFEISGNSDDDFISPEISMENEEIYTENMVNIYIKQGRYQQALEILRKICTSNPKKSTNFASQIKLLEVIIKDNK